MTLKITLSAKGNKGVDFNKAYAAFFEDFAPSGSPEFLGRTASETTQIVHLATPEPGQEAKARAVLLEGSDFLYTFSNHTVSGELDTIRLVTLGKAYDADTGELVLKNGVVKTATPHITISNLDLDNPAGVAGPVHEIVAGMMGGGPSGSLADPAPITEVLWGEAHNVTGSSGDDTYAGTKFGDVVRGLRGDDVLNGRGGNDRITGGLGADKLTGGGKADTFIFTSARETKGDLIRDFDPSENDRIKLSSIDADSGKRGNQSFDFIGTDGFSGDAGELRYKVGAAKTTVLGDIDGDGSADFRIALSGQVTLADDSFLL